MIYSYTIFYSFPDDDDDDDFALHKGCPQIRVVLICICSSQGVSPRTCSYYEEEEEEDDDDDYDYDDDVDDDDDDDDDDDYVILYTIL